ncbi:glutamine amidotransferase [bacterium]|nr:glutamine amidotransferase [bacterium]
MEENLEITFAHIYPKLLNLYGDIGNVLTLKKRCEWRGINFIAEEINLGDEFREHDMYFIGGGQDRQQVDVACELQKHKHFLTEERDKNVVFLSICGGYQLLGHYYKAQDGSELKGIDLLDAYTLAGNKRFIGNVTTQIDYLKPNTLVGFENHSGLTYLEGETKSISTILTGHGNNGEDKTEGARFKNVFGTYLHGSFLPKNPHFADYLIELALEKRYGYKIELKPLDDEIELNTHKNLVNKPY